MKVVITRAPNSYIKASEITVDLIQGLEWGNISGGVNLKQAGYSLYGYINYEIAKELVDCSGSHSLIAHNARICIPAKLNNQTQYREGYAFLAKQAGFKPENVYKKRWPNGIPCNKAIRNILLEKSSCRREEVRTILIKQGYLHETIRNSIKYLENSGAISLNKSSNNPQKHVITILK